MKTMQYAWAHVRGIPLYAILLMAQYAFGSAVWTGAGDGSDWFDSANWDPQAVPGSCAEVTVGSGSIVLTNATAEMASFHQTGGTLTFSGWETALRADEITISGTVTHLPVSTSTPNALGEWVPDHRVWLVGSNITVTATGKLNTDEKGYRNWAGPGRPASGKSGGGGHASQGGRATNGAPGGPAYGDPSAPWQPGSSGGSTACGPGGGAIRIEASGLLTLNGMLTANGGVGSYPGGNGGSGGSIWLTCRTVAGDTTGRISAKGSAASINEGGAGAAGRIAVSYQSTAQSAQPIPGFCMDTSPGAPKADDVTAYLGTLYLPDALFLTTGMTNRFCKTELRIPGLSTWNPSRLHLDNCTFGLPPETALAVSGDAVLANGAGLWVRAAATADPLTVDGATVTVGGDLVLGNNSWIHPYAEPTNGATVAFLVSGDLSIDATSGFNADFKGYLRGYGPGRAYTGTSFRLGGGGYGGAGSTGETYPGGPAYGDASLANQAGGGGMGATVAGNGGGAIRLAVCGDALIDGTLTACGSKGSYLAGGGGAGGGIRLVCRTLQGSGQFRADGGAPNERAGSGGGGRIAIHYDPSVQGALPIPGVKFSTYAPPSGQSGQVEEMGTLYLPNVRFVTESLAGQRFWHVRLVIPGWTAWAPGSLTLDNCVVGLPRGFSLDVAGDLSLRNSARLYLWPSPTNDPAHAFGLALNVGGTLDIGDSSWLYTYAEPTNGAIMRIRVGGNAVIASTGGINGDYRGYISKTGNLNGPGAGRGNSSGGGYGGKGGGTAGGAVYGDPAAVPRHPGSPGGAYPGGASGGWQSGTGGGAIQLLSAGTVVLDGTLSANGSQGVYPNAPGGSGGAILVVGRKVSGAGLLSANGGTGLTGGGGGGRIAVWHKTSLEQFDAIYGSLNLNNVTISDTPPTGFTGTYAVNTAGATVGQPGTAVFCLAPPLATVIVVR